MSHDLDKSLVEILHIPSVESGPKAKRYSQSFDCKKYEREFSEHIIENSQSQHNIAVV